MRKRGINGKQDGEEEVGIKVEDSSLTLKSYAKLDSPL